MRLGRFLAVVALNACWEKPQVRRRPNMVPQFCVWFIEFSVPELVLKNPITGALSHIVVGTDAFVSSSDYNVKPEMTQLAIE